MPSIADLIADGRIERVGLDDDEAAALLEHANLHLESAQAIVAADIAGAYQLLYDAARKSIAAHMSAHGYRAKSDRPGAHAAVAAYATEPSTVA